MQFKQALKELESLELSPNLAEVNKHLINTKDRLDLDQDVLNKAKVFKFGVKSPIKGLALSPSKEMFMDDHSL